MICKLLYSVLFTCIHRNNFFGNGIIYICMCIIYLFHYIKNIDIVKFKKTSKKENVGAIALILHNL